MINRLIFLGLCSAPFVVGYDLFRLLFVRDWWWTNDGGQLDYHSDWRMK